MAVTESKQAFRALIAIGVAARDAGRDGWQITDGGLLVRDDSLQQVLVDAFEGSEKIPRELSNLTFADTIDLVTELAGAAKMFERK